MLITIGIFAGCVEENIDVFVVGGILIQVRPTNFGFQLWFDDGVQGQKISNGGVTWGDEILILGISDTGGYNLSHFLNHEVWIYYDIICETGGHRILDIVDLNKY